MESSECGGVGPLDGGASEALGQESSQRTALVWLGF